MEWTLIVGGAIAVGLLTIGSLLRNRSLGARARRSKDLARTAREKQDAPVPPPSTARSKSSDSI